MTNSDISIVIPVYNEEDYISDCLDAIAKQSVAPLEVILVDNNCTDKTVEKAKKYAFVKVVKEETQGVVFASFKGFSVAKGKIMGRIDGDSRINVDWIKNVTRTFNQKNIDAVTGRQEYYDMVFSGFFNWVDKSSRDLVINKLKASPSLQGSNMAVRKSSWLKVKDELCLTNEVQEEIDLAIHLNRNGGIISYNPNMIAGVSVRRFNNGYFDGFKYYRLLPLTYKRHSVKHYRVFYLALLVITLCYIPGLVAFRLHGIKNK